MAYLFDDRICWFACERYASCADGRAFRTTGLFERLEEGLLTVGNTIPRGRYFILADNAYPLRRSEEHTSELQSLMRSSYAVFCLKKKKTKNIRHMTHKQ